MTHMKLRPPLTVEDTAWLSIDIKSQGYAQAVTSEFAHNTYAVCRRGNYSREISLSREQIRELTLAATCFFNLENTTNIELLDQVKGYLIKKTQEVCDHKSQLISEDYTRLVKAKAEREKLDLEISRLEKRIG